MNTVSTQQSPGGQPADVRMSLEQLKQRMDSGEDIKFLDARAEYSEATHQVPGAMKMRPEEAQTRAHELAKDQTYLAYCTWPNEGSSASLAQQLQGQGYKVYALKGGYNAWRSAGMPVEPK